MDIDGGNWYPMVNNGYVSHYCWCSDTELLVYSTERATGTELHLYCGRSDSVSPVAPESVFRDGHPSYFYDSRFLVIDTYPDEFGDQNLLIVDTLEDSAIELGRYYSPLSYRAELRCDLHPRHSPKGNLVSVDSAEQGRRAIYLVDISWFPQLGEKSSKRIS